MKKLLTFQFLLCLLFPISQNTVASSPHLEEYITDEIYNVIWSKYYGNWGNSFFMNANIASDNMFPAGGGASDRPEYQMTEDFSFDPTVVSSKMLWQVSIDGITKCNYLLYQAEQTGQDESSLIAETKFLRAYLYFNFARIFGDVPIIETACIPVVHQVSRNPLTEVYAFIIKDLTDAVSGLPTKANLSEESNFRATQGAAQALLGKVYLYNQEWSKALTTLENVINSGNYALEASFTDIWAEDNEHGIESIFELVYSPNHWDWSSTKNTANIDIQLTGIRGLSNSDDYNDGWGFCTVTEDLVDAFVNAGDTDRMHASIIFADTLTNHGATFDKFAHQHTGYWSKKYTASAQTNMEFSYSSYGQNEIQLRYADVLLMAAEAAYQFGNDIKAQNYLNQVRARAGLTEVLSTGNTLLEAIYNERRLELAFEGNRFFDLRRWGLLESTLSAQGFNTNTNGLWPIPQDIIDLNPDMLQNPSYSSGSSPDFTGNVMHSFNYDPLGQQTSPFPQFRKSDKDIISIASYKYNVCLNDSIIQSKAIYSRNQNGKRTEFLSMGYNVYNEAFEDKYKTVYEYDDNGNLTSHFSYQYNFTENSWQPTGWNQEFTYNADNYITQVTSYISDFAVEKGEYTWDENYEDYVYIHYNSSGEDAWTIFEESKIDNTFENGKLVLEIRSSKYKDETEYNLNRKREWIYAADESSMEQLYYTVNGQGEFVLDHKTLENYTYNSEGKLSAIIFNYYDVAKASYGDPESKTEYIFNNEDKTEMVKGYTYSAATQNFVPNTEALLYSYNSFSTHVDADINSDSKSIFSIFPNPVDDHLNIECTANVISTATLYSIDGKLIEQFSFTNSISIPITHLQPQVCILNVSNNKSTESIRIIIE